MKTLKFFLIPALLLFLAACTEDVPTPADVPDGSAAIDVRAKESVTKPMKIWVEATIDYSVARKPCDCDPPCGVTIPAKGWMRGHATHMGKLNRMESPWEHGTCDLAENKIVITGSHGIWTGANGDQIWWEGDYEVFFNGNFSADLDIVGGTGRFEGAVGNVRGDDGVTDPETGYGSGTAQGWVTVFK
jgi:hypothetical protein